MCTQECMSQRQEHDLRLLFLECANHKSLQHVQTGSIAVGDEGGGSICGGMSSPGHLKYLARRTLEQCFLAEASLRLERRGKLAALPSSSSSSSHGMFVFLPHITLTVAGASKLRVFASWALKSNSESSSWKGGGKKRTRGPETSDMEKEEKRFR